MNASSIRQFFLLLSFVSPIALALSLAVLRVDGLARGGVISNVLFVFAISASLGAVTMLPWAYRKLALWQRVVAVIPAAIVAGVTVLFITKLTQSA